MKCKELMVGDFRCSGHGFPMYITNVFNRSFKCNFHNLNEISKKSHKSLACVDELRIF